MLALLRLIVPAIVASLAHPCYAQPAESLPAKPQNYDIVSNYDGNPVPTGNDGARFGSDFNLAFDWFAKTSARRPTNVSGLAAAVNGSNVTLSWGTPPGPATARYVSRDGGAAVQLTPNVTTWTDTNVPAGSHQWTIASRNIVTTGPWAGTYAPIAPAPSAIATVAGVPPPTATGACCAPSGSCSVMTQAACVASGGIYRGDNITCAAANCQGPPPTPTGACCSPIGTCSIMTASACSASGGVYKGDNVTCAAANCTQIPPPPSTGWTDLTPPAGAVVVYVSATGNDGNAGTQTSPLRTLSAGYSRLRDGFADQVLLKCGDVWNESGHQIVIDKGCATAGKYLVIGSYGVGPRPKIICAENGFNGEAIGKRGIAIVDIEIQGPKRFDTRAIRLLGWKDVLIEGCDLHHFNRAIIFQGWGSTPRASGLKLRRNVVRDITFDGATTGQHAQGTYIDFTDNWLMEENIWVRCGIEGSIFSRPGYIQSNCGRGTFSGNIMALNPAEGVQVRPGGTVLNNLSIRNPIGIYVAGDSAGTNDVRWNVVLESGDISAADRRGIGIHVSGPSTVKDNVVANNTGTGEGAVKGIFLNGASGEVSGNVIWDWTRSSGPGLVDESFGIHIEGGSGTLVLSNNIVHQVRRGFVAERLNTGLAITGTGNVYSVATGMNPFRDKPGTWDAAARPAIPDLSVQGLTGVSAEAFVADCLLQSKQRWLVSRTADVVNDIVRQRCGIGANP